LAAMNPVRAAPAKSSSAAVVRRDSPDGDPAIADPGVKRCPQFMAASSTSPAPAAMGRRHDAYDRTRTSGCSAHGFLPPQAQPPRLTPTAKPLPAAAPSRPRLRLYREDDS
jgi:hypothetical protein